MSVFLSLTREHQLFQSLLGRLERCLKLDEEESRRELRQVLLVLLPALERHEEVEDRIFEDPEYRRQRGAQKLLAAVDAQHRKIEGLHDQLLELLRTEERYEFESLKTAVFTLCEKLRLHFHSEETILWPHYGRSMSAPRGHSLERKAKRLVSRLEREIAEISSAASHYAR